MYPGIEMVFSWDRLGVGGKNSFMMKMKNFKVDSFYSNNVAITEPLL